MQRFHVQVVRSLILAGLVATTSSLAVVAQREILSGVCHTDDATGEVAYLEVSGAEFDAHLRHGDMPAPNGPDDCATARDPDLPEEVRPTDAPPRDADVPAPIALDDEYEAQAGAPLVVPAPGVLENDRGFTMATLVREPSWGTLDFGRDGSFTYVADREHPGTDVFAYQATNEEGHIDIGEVYIFLPAGVNSPPVAIDDTFGLQGAAPFVVAAPGVLANDSDPDGDPISLVGFATGVKGGPAPHGNADGSFTFIPIAGLAGEIFSSYPYTTIITDGQETAQSSLVLNIQLDPDSPVAVYDTYTTPASGTLTVGAANGLLANDSSPVGSGLTASLHQTSPNAVVTIAPDGSFTCTIPGGATPGSFLTVWYQVIDSQGRAVLQQVSINFQ